jgi:paraquat-inducible protein A
LTGAAALGLWTCHDCALLVRAPTAGHHGRCPRCGAPVHRRKTNSIARTWALTLAATVLYIPANVFPVMTVTSLGRAQSDTIMSGVLYLLEHGMWPLAALIFFASVFVPLLKLIAIAFLLLKLIAIAFLLTSVQRGWAWRAVDRTRLYRLAEVVGRWSMVDIYVVTILVALVKLGNLASIEAGVGAIFFGSVVVITMLAAESFDPRLIWDAIEHRDE